MATRPRRALRTEHCVPCSTGDRLGIAQRHELHHDVPDWDLQSHRLVRDLTFKDFATALRFANAVGRIAEAEDHHPALHLSGYKHLRIELTTHAARGLSRNDFILAARIDAVLARPAWQRSLAKQRRRPARARRTDEAFAYPMPPF